MSQVKVSGNASGTGVFEIAAPNSNTSYTITLPQATTTLVGTDATQTLTNKTLTSPTLTTPNINSAQFATVEGTAPLYGCRAWVVFDGQVAGTFAGGTSTVTRVAGSTTATVTTTNPHTLTTGNYVYAATGVAAGAYAVTVLTSTTFTVTTVATTALTAASITFSVATITGSGNVNSVAKVSAGNYYINFTVGMPDANYATSAAAPESNTGGAPYSNVVISVNPSIAAVQITTSGSNAGGAYASAFASVMVFR